MTCSGCDGSGEVIENGMIKACPRCGGQKTKGCSMKKVGAWVGAAALAMALSACPGGDITPGGRCSAQGSKHTNSNGHSYTCEWNNVHKFNWWVQDKPLTPDRP